MASVLIFSRTLAIDFKIRGNKFKSSHWERDRSNNNDTIFGFDLYQKIEI